MALFCVYCHIAPNGKIYVGITSQHPRERWCNGNGYKENTHFYNAIKKYGWDSFQHWILFIGLTIEEASSVEKDLIKGLMTTDQANGYNIAEGGFGGGHPTSEETKKKISMANRGKKCPEYQKKWLSQLNKGKMPTNLEAIHKGNMKKVDQFDMNWNYMTTFPSISIAGEKCGISGGSIGKCCRGEYNHAGHYKWKYAEGNA